MPRNITSAWERLDLEEKELNLEAERLKRIWLKIAEIHRSNQEERELMETEANLSFISTDSHITLNIGGQLFETKASILMKDKYSILASLCWEEPPIEPISDDPHRTFYIDRDWWIFQPILQYLRSNLLPEDPYLLKELYIEATFYRLISLQHAIEKRIISRRENKNGFRKNHFYNPDLPPLPSDNTAALLATLPLPTNTKNIAQSLFNQPPPPFAPGPYHDHTFHQRTMYNTNNNINYNPRDERSYYNHNHMNDNLFHQQCPECIAINSTSQIPYHGPRLDYPYDINQTRYTNNRNSWTSYNPYPTNYNPYMNTQPSAPPPLNQENRFLPDPFGFTRSGYIDGLNLNISRQIIQRNDDQKEN